MAGVRPTARAWTLSSTMRLNSNARLNFWSYPQTTSAPSMTLMNGNLGIGTATPQGKLDILPSGGYTSPAI